MTRAVDHARFEPASDFIVLVARPVSPSPSVSLVIRACAQEWRTLDAQVRHIVDQLEGPSPFCERLLALDSREDGFVRQYDTADLAAARRAADALVGAGVIDAVVACRADREALVSLYGRWFDLTSEATHTVAGAPVALSLAGFEAVTGDYVLPVDADIMVVRRDRSHDYLREMVDVLGSTPDGLTASLNICHAEARPWTTEGGGAPGVSRLGPAYCTAGASAQVARGGTSSSTARTRDRGTGQQTSRSASKASRPSAAETIARSSSTRRTP